MNLLSYPTSARIPENVAAAPGLDGLRRKFASEEPPFTKLELQCFVEGRNYRAYKMLGAHLCTFRGEVGVHFAVWAPNARQVQVIGDFNSWSKDGQAIHLKPQSGVWCGFVPGVKKGMRYKYLVSSRHNG
jgi:1,4-alpha-glucan branching enzyme